MSVIQKLFDAQNNQDIKAYNEVVSEDYNLGKTLNWRRNSKIIKMN